VDPPRQSIPILLRVALVTKGNSTTIKVRLEKGSLERVQFA